MEEQLYIYHKKSRLRKALYEIYICVLVLATFIIIDFYYLHLNVQERVGLYIFLAIFFSSFYFFIIRFALRKKGYFEFKLTKDVIFYRNGDVVFDRKISEIKSLIDKSYVSDYAVGSQMIEFTDGDYYCINEFFNYGLNYKKVFKAIKKINPSVNHQIKKQY